MRIYTRTGDKGETGLVGGTRVPKDDAVIESLGDLDELNAQIGMLLTYDMPTTVSQRLRQVQGQIFAIGATVAGSPQHLDRRLIHELEDDMDALEMLLSALHAFILPGGSPLAAQFHVARTVCRRCERRMVKLGVPVELINRLSDWMFCQARAANARAGLPDIEWKS